ncbi:hypothetical protein [Streptomyces sp. NBC_00344]|uniref:hypothetical protein n=1 Tax=Streptomyces sp. NBC_00344 TaxID=2975720 RepID=UPI002E20E4A2
MVSIQRVDRAVLPQMRVAVTACSYGWAPPVRTAARPRISGPYFDAKAATDHLAKSYAVELARFGSDTALVVPGSFTSGTNHFAHAMQPQDTATAEAHDAFYASLMDEVGKRLATLAPPDADVNEVARAIVAISQGSRPFGTTIGPADDGSEKGQRCGRPHPRRLLRPHRPVRPADSPGGRLTSRVRRWGGAEEPSHLVCGCRA